MFAFGNMCTSANMCTCTLLCFVLFVLCFCIFWFIYIYSYLLLVQELLPPSENSIAVNNNNNNNLKYKYLTIEIQSMWNVKTKVIPVIIGATGTISKTFRKYVSNIPGNHEVKELQKTAILGTAHILRKVLM